ncbi:pirin family protein [Arenibacter sp. GZD96]|uniref:pirin family protein n=1 Tax=Aurantibrevibacter litoralis TaxID=3106030 RepID=UPI002AFFD47D|nr:pirin family protein [Arenibacter sp. GZD-96]MEA1787001.1 pirin family protein [Arenibacter sp. GZD-96]
MATSIKHIYPLGFPWKTEDPFLFCVHHHDFFPKGNDDLGPDSSLEGRNIGNDFTIKDGWRMYHGHTVPGFPAHPHCGFETVTIVNKGFCDHSDSLGAAGRFGEGDVQWMTAGSGVQHSEMFPLLHRDKENTLELFQLWLNLPKSKKYADPHFSMLWHEDIPVLHTDEAIIKIVAGTFKGTNALPPAPDSWAADVENEVAIWNITLKKNKTLTLPKATDDINRNLYFYAGDTLEIEGQKISATHGVSLVASIDTLLQSGSEDAHILILQGKPIQEPVATYGPFVMNTQDEIQQVMQNFRATQFGGWPWRYPDNVHAREKGRFAKYPDGTVIEK